jgi:hypothetical protein
LTLGYIADEERLVHEYGPRFDSKLQQELQQQMHHETG